VNEQPTCGKGLAEHSALPAKLGELTAAIAENLEVHRKALDLTDENARKEYEAYVKLAQEYRTIASQLQATAEHMACRWAGMMNRRWLHRRSSKSSQTS
jgi:hypothetical protein